MGRVSVVVTVSEGRTVGRVSDGVMVSEGMIGGSVPVGMIVGSVPVGMIVGSVPDGMSVSVGTTPGMVSDGTREEITSDRDDSMLDTMLPMGSEGRVAVPVGSTSDATLVAMLEMRLERSGSVVGRSPAMDDTKLLISEINDGRTGEGVTPGGVVVGAVGPAVGSVTPVPELGTIPGSDRMGSESDLLSEVGIGSESVGDGDSVGDVPRAVVMPTKMPVPEVGSCGTVSDVGKRVLVGRILSLGTPPDPVGRFTSVSVGCTISVGSPDEGIMNGPMIVVPSVEVGS